ncbi:uncharacterized protein [Epargyreus clarus]|uniref:uncharacterized protein n=1 Tax=Epargyreus clarus TaxID=520877 RepID=UPI003C2D366C
MESDAFVSGAEGLYPILIIPKTCTTLETNCEVSDNVFIDLNITSPDIEGNDTCIYSGFCNVKLIDNGDVNTQDQGLSVATSDANNNDQVTIVDSGTTYPAYSQSQVWIDPARSPFVYNNYDTAESQERYSVYHQSHTSHITVEQHNTYITQNVYNCKESVHYSPIDEFEHKKFRKIQNETNNQNSLEEQNLYEDDEFECGVFLSKLPEEIWNEKETKAREEMKYVDLQSDNDALKQLMSSDIQSLSKQQKTILFLGHDSHFGQTIQKIAINDPYLECVVADQNDVENEVVIGETKITKPNQKKYQCDKCKQIFDQIAEFKQHMVGNHRSPKISIADPSEVKFMCLECGKNLKNQKKFEMHCLGHGNPELECDKCHKVFASKFTLRIHRKIHLRKPSTTCNIFREHTSTEMTRDSSADLSCLGDDFDSSTLSPIPETPDDIEQDIIGLDKQDEISRADSIIAKVVSNKMFLLHSKKVKRGRKYRNACDVCLKTFDRVGDLKRHLIEHVIRSTLAKNPVNRHGALNILCEVCQAETFTKVDKYKAHLREHAKLTIYKCTFCDKSFSDSSNFSKHKKIHGTTYFQCDLCQRKFNSKKMITQHMEYHNKNSPICCLYCDKVFHFESMLNKHIKCAHKRERLTRFRCRFCHKYFKSLKEKWDHEWIVHNVRKMIVDCMICGAKFRKYYELKRHCSNVHNMDIPPAKKLLRKRKST